MNKMQVKNQITLPFALNLVILGPVKEFFLLLILNGFSILSLAQQKGPVNPTIPQGFVRLKDVDPGIAEEIRYAGFHNFLGRPVRGYYAPECWLTSKAAEALHQVQLQALKSSYSLKVYDCYRPGRAVEDFVTWAKDLKDQKMKAEFFPNEPKERLFTDGYIAARSGHSRGSTVDLTLVPSVHGPETPVGQQLVSCTQDVSIRYPDSSLDMGTGFDCFDIMAHGNSQQVSALAQENRKKLADLMIKAGFNSLPEEWWHFTLKEEPFPGTYFDFPIQNGCPDNIQMALKNSRQLLIAESQDMNSFSAEVSLWSRLTDNDVWHKDFGTVPAVIGKNGMGWAPPFVNLKTEGQGLKQEGDGRSAAGIFPLGTLFGFAAASTNNEPYRSLDSQTECVDDPRSKFYNKIVDADRVLKDWTSSEKMLEVPQYKWGYEINYPTDASHKAGSCLFVHILKTPWQGTAGCLALEESGLAILRAKIRKDLNPKIVILPKISLRSLRACLPQTGPGD